MFDALEDLLHRSTRTSDVDAQEPVAFGTEFASWENVNSVIEGPY